MAHGAAIGIHTMTRTRLEWNGRILLEKGRSLIVARSDQRFRAAARKEPSSTEAMPFLPPEIAKISAIPTLESTMGEVN